METVLLYILGIAIILIGLALSIGLHEIGHLVPAKLFGVKVTQYMVGFGRTIWSRKRGETEYGIKAIPLGGYISMIGMFPPGKDGTVRDSSTGFLQTLADERPAALRRSGTEPESEPEAEEADDSGQPRKRFFSQLVDDARESSAETIGDNEDHRTFYRLAVWKRVIIMAGGPLMNLILAVVFVGIVVMGFGIAKPSTTLGTVNECILPVGSTATTCEPGATPAPGALAGILPGDTMLSMNGQELHGWDDASEIIRTSAGQNIDLVVQRGDQTVDLALTPLMTERYVLDDRNRPVMGEDGKPLTERVGFVGMGPINKVVTGGPEDVFPLIGDNIGAVVNMIVHLPERLVGIAQAAFGSGERDVNGPVSVVGVGRIAGEFVAMDSVGLADKASFIFGLLGSLNVALFAFNLIPLMPLDGGHIAAAAWEGIRRFFAKLFRRRDPGPVDAAKMMPVTLVVAVLMGGMTVLLIFADLVNPINIFK